MSARDADGVGGRQDPRAWDHALPDGVAQGDVRELPRPHVADGREAGLERQERVANAADRVLLGEVAHPCVLPVVPLPDRPARQMDVRVDEARDDRDAGQVDDAVGVGRRAGPDALDMPVVDEDPLPHRRVAEGVDLRGPIQGLHAGGELFRPGLIGPEV